MQPNSRAGLTLVELVVVLVILVLVAGTALTATEGLVEESRYETTRSELRHVESSLLGAYDASSSGEATAIAFAADVGRLPRAGAGGPETALAELWEAPPGVDPFAIQAPAGDPEVRLPGGWRGPYLRLGLGTARLLDGWARPYGLLAADGTTCPPGTELAMIQSLGADGTAGGTSYDADAIVVFERTVPPLVGARHAGDVPVRVRPSSAAGAGANVVVRLYGPRDGRVVTLAQHVVPAAGSDVLYMFVRVPVGPRSLRAYQTDDDPTATPDAPIAAPTARSPIRAITVVQGGLAEVEIQIP